MAKNAGESRIPLPRTVRPSLLPKPRSSYGSSKTNAATTGAGHRRSPVYFPSGSLFPGKQQNQQQRQQHQHQHQHQHQQQQFNSGAKDLGSKQPKAYVRNSTTPDKDQDNFLDADYSLSSIWNLTTDNKEADLLIRSQEDLVCIKKKQQSSEKELSCSDSDRVILGGGGDGNDFAIESPVGTAPHYLMLTKQNSFEHDESLGILTPDQMTDFTVALESSRTPSCENLSGHANSGKFLFGKSKEIVAAAARHFDLATRIPSIETFILPNDRSPSLEELPLDPKPTSIVEKDANSLDTALLSTEVVSPTVKRVAIDSSETSEHVNEQPRCGIGGVGGVGGVGQTLPTSFITSVTSITSLEAGYQGDGENSRPASRGPEPLSNFSAANLLVNAACKQDPMTDSDFFTESDVDVHEEIGRGDRRAQVIDGTLFCAPNERRCPSFEPCEEMDSSGIYSDLDKRQDSVCVDGEGYGDGDHTTDTGDTEVSMKSQLSPQEKMPVTALVTKNMLSPQDIIFNESKESSSSLSAAEVTVIKCQKNEQNSETKSKSSNISNKENSALIKKYKMPKRNVISKIKTMIESNQNLVTKQEPEKEVRRPQRQQRKTGRWDAVMNKIEAGKQRGRSLKKEVKSRVLQGLGTSTSSTASTSSTRRPKEDANNNANNKDKRRIRGRTDMNSPNQETSRSSARSSASDLSSAHSKEAQSKRPQRKNCIDAHQPNNRQFNSNIVNSNKSNISTVRKAPSIKSVQTNVNAKQKNTTTNKVADRNSTNSSSNANNRASSVVGKDHGCNNGPILNNHRNNNNNHNNNNNNNNNNLNNNHHHHHHHHHHNNNNSNNNNHVVVVTEGISLPAALPALPSSQHQLQKLDTKEQEIQTDLHEILLPKTEDLCEQCDDDDQDDYNGWSHKAENTIQALAITVQYFTRQLEDLPSCRLKKELEKMKTEWLSASSELEELRLRKASIDDALNQERDEHLKSIQSLREDLKREKAERLSLEQTVQESQRRAQEFQESLQERERELGQVRAAQSTQDQGALFAEVESLRTVLEIRSQENAQLRSEVDLLRRELDEKELLKQKCDGLEARCEDLKAQLQSKESFERQLTHDNEVLMGSIHQMSKQNKRLSQRNEELLWRLRQKNEVVSVLTNQLTPQSQRLSKSLGPEHTDHPDHPSTDCSQNSELQNCSMVKYMVEKGDSVSWTLDITESMESSNNSSNYKTPTPSLRRYHENNGALVSRQGSLRLPMSRRTSIGSGRARSNSVSVAESPRIVNSGTEDQVWNPSYNSTPLQRRRNNIGTSEKLWSLSNTVPEATNSVSSCSGSTSVIFSGASNSTKSLGVEVSTTDEDDEDEEEEEEVVGQRPQEAGGEAMISEETSASSSNEDDESSVSSSDIP